MKTKISRRHFLKKSSSVAAAAIGLPYVISATALGKDGAVAPSNRIAIGCIGLGGQGTRNMLEFAKNSDVEIAALCDINSGSDDYTMLYQFPGSSSAGLEPAEKRLQEHLKKPGKQAGRTIKKYSDFRELLANGDIDAVSICTPDHWHGLVSMAAAKAGKDIYCEKPLTNTIAEGRAVCDAVKRYARVFQTGSHLRSNQNVRYACELVRNGRIGKLHTIRINLPCNDTHHLRMMEMNKNLQPVMTVPPSLDYDMWLGPTPAKSYTALRSHFYWRFILDYGGGEMTDRGAHIIDIGQLANNTDDTGPIELKAKGIRSSDGIFDTFFDYDFECTYANGVKMIGTSKAKRGIKLEGTDGWIFINDFGGKMEASKPSILKELIGPDEIHLGRSPGHHRNFLDAVLARRFETVATAEIGHRSATICHLLNIAMITEQELKWDPVKERITNSGFADKMVTRPMRSPWHII